MKFERNIGSGGRSKKEALDMGRFGQITKSRVGEKSGSRIACKRSAVEFEPNRRNGIRVHPRSESERNRDERGGDIQWDGSRKAQEINRRCEKRMRVGCKFLRKAGQREGLDVIADHFSASRILVVFEAMKVGERTGKVGEIGR